MTAKQILLYSIASIALVSALAGGCAVREYGVHDQAHVAALNCCTLQPGSATQNAIAATAGRLVGARTIQAGGRLVSYDCAGVTRAIYLSQGTDLYEGGAVTRQANGVGLIYEHVRKYGRLHRGPVIHPGDLVFFDNTWDVNDDGVVNDRLTHVGVVESVERDGTVIFISRVAQAVERYRMNLRTPNVVRASDGRTLNDYLRRKKPGDPLATGYLTGQLFAGFGTLSE